MPRGLDQKIFFPVRPEYEDYDRQRVETYLETLKKGKENKGVSFFTQEGKKGEHKGIFIVLVDRSEEAKAEAKGYQKKWQN